MNSSIKNHFDRVSLFFGVEKGANKLVISYLCLTVIGGWRR